MYKKTVVFEFILMLEDGGAQALVKDYALLLNKDKFDVHVITLWKIPGAINSDILRENGINDIGIYNGMTFFNRAFNKLCGWFFPALKLRFLMRKYKPDCLHFHLNLAKYVKQATRKDRNIRLFYTSHAEPEVNFDSPKEIKTVDWLIKNKNLKVIALHNKMKRELDEIFGISDTIVLHNGINIARFTDVKEKKSDIRQMLGIPENAYVIGCVARFCKVKNHSFLIDVFADVKRKNPDAFLFLVGSGNLQSEIESKLNSKGLAGSYLILSKRTDIPRLLKAMDVFSLTSFSEGFPLVCIEAQAAGLPCIVSEGSPTDAVLSEHTARIGLEEPVDKWSNAILNPPENSNHGNLADYDMQSIVTSLENIYTD